MPDKLLRGPSFYKFDFIGNIITIEALKICCLLNIFNQYFVMFLVFDIRQVMPSR